MILTCPACGRKFELADPHHPFRCPHCGALLDYVAPLGRVELIMTTGEVLGR